MPGEERKPSVVEERKVLSDKQYKSVKSHLYKTVDAIPKFIDLVANKEEETISRESEELTRVDVRNYNPVRSRRLYINRENGEYVKQELVCFTRKGSNGTETLKVNGEKLIFNGDFYGSRVYTGWEEYDDQATYLLPFISVVDSDGNIADDKVETKRVVVLTEKRHTS